MSKKKRWLSFWKKGDAFDDIQYLNCRFSLTGIRKSDYTGEEAR